MKSFDRKNSRKNSARGGRIATKEKVSAKGRAAGIPGGEVLFPEPGATPAEDTAAVMKFYKLAKGFPAAVTQEAEQVSADGNDLSGRRDLRGKFIFTCDPESARDFDDAISIETDRRGNRVLGVHIADVSHFVRPGGALDREAYRRSTSAYLCDRVVPMLPERLSNGVCSLVPGEDRLTFSAFITFDRDGEPVRREFVRSVIRSKARFTYEQVMGVIAGSAGGKRKPGISQKAVRAIRETHALAQQLRARRFAAGALDLEIPEAEVRLDAAGEMEGIEIRPYDESHQMIEECMVAANEAVAKELWTKGVKILTRLHEPPDPEKLLLLRAELRALGVKLGDIGKPRVFAQFLQSIKRHPLYSTIAMMVLRSMKRAVYDSTAIGHFGLAKKFYAHFTSPIRRYPDLTLHRQLAAYLADGGAEGPRAPDSCRVPPRLLARWAGHVTEMEEIATEAERALAEIKKYRLLEAELNARTPVTYEAVIAKCTPYGCFVEIPSLAVSGLVHISRFSRGFVRFNESDQSLSAGGRRSWRIGEKMKVRVTRVDYRARKLDFEPVDDDRAGRRNGGRHSRRGR